jgi:hypothetical protein
VLLLAVLSGLLLWLAHDPLEAARQRVQVGSDEAAVTAAVGREPDGAIGGVDSHPGPPHPVLYWQYADDFLLVVFDRDGKAVIASRYAWGSPALWDRLRAYLPW